MRNALLILPAMTAAAGSNGAFIITRKFLDGVLEYVRHWPGQVVVGFQRSDAPSGNLDPVEVSQADVPFAMCWFEPTDAQSQQRMAEARLVLASLVDKHAHLAAVARSLGVPLVYVCEYSAKTRQQIIWAETSNPLLRWRRELWNAQLERRFEQAVQLAAGLQCNGTPTYLAYKALNAHALLYFDTRVRESQLVDPQLLEARITQMLDGRPLRLAFSGRLIAMKGADHLPRVAAELRRLGVPFTMDICGDGELTPRLRREIQRAGLGECVHLRGVLDFHSELMPLIASEIDLFVCCHRQGDPSCTYLETMSCGTPIAGYDNEAFRGIVRTSDVGWLSPMNKPQLLAARIAELHARRDELAEAARAARAFAVGHTFEQTMRLRIDHMLACAQRHEHQPLVEEARA